MKYFLTLTLISSLGFAIQAPVECYKNAEKNNVLYGFDALRLCTGATEPNGPINCYKAAGFGNSFDGIRLCRGATTANNPAQCYKDANANGITGFDALRLCAPNIEMYPCSH